MLLFLYPKTNEYEVMQMGRARSPDSIEAEKLYQKGWKLVDIAKELGVPEGTVRRWKSTQGWESERSDKKANVRKKKGGQLGNKNATGFGAPKQNKNAVTTGEFETLFFDCLEPQELELVDTVVLDKHLLLLQEIQLLTVREHRMLKRVEWLKGQGSSVELLEQIQNIENALTRVQASKQRAIDSLHRYGYDDAKLEIELMRLELELAKQDTSDDTQVDDGFLSALGDTALDVWSGEDE